MNTLLTQDYKIMKNKILVTGSAGFIGFHLAMALVKRGDIVVGLDNINDYYDTTLKYSRLNELGIKKDEIVDNTKSRSEIFQNFSFYKINIQDNVEISKLFLLEGFDIVVNLAAQAGVRYSMENPYIYIESNCNGFISILEACRHNKVKNLVYASTSSVYGLNYHMPLIETESTEHPMTLYAATKKANEMMAHSYSHLFGLPTTGLRFFTVYGPWGRPDMALFLFTKNILENKPINVFNNGNMVRDFTYVDDIVQGIIKCVDNPAKPNLSWHNNSIIDPSTSSAPYNIYNIGNSNPTLLNHYIEAIETSLNKKAIKNLLPMQLGDVPETHADISSITAKLNFKPRVTIQEGVKNFVKWYLDYYKK